MVLPILLEYFKANPKFTKDRQAKTQEETANRIHESQSPEYQGGSTKVSSGTGKGKVAGVEKKGNEVEVITA